MVKANKIEIFFKMSINYALFAQIIVAKNATLVKQTNALAAQLETFSITFRNPLSV
jgi:hypothetical protein